MVGSKRLTTYVLGSLAVVGVLSVLAAAVVGAGLFPPAAAHAASLPGADPVPDTFSVSWTSASSNAALPALGSSLLVSAVTTSPAKLATSMVTRTPARTKAVRRIKPRAKAKPKRVRRPAPARVNRTQSTKGFRNARASWYGPGFYGHTMAGGGKLQRNSMVLAHKSLPFGTRVLVSYRGKTVTAVVRDRGPYVGGREFDLGPGVAKALGFSGVHTIRVKVLGR